MYSQQSVSNKLRRWPINERKTNGDSDWSKDENAIKFGDDAVAEERVSKGVGYPKNLLFPFSTWLNDNPKERLDSKIFV